MKVRNTRFEGSVMVTEWADKVITKWDLAELADDIRGNLERHGLAQKTMDAHSGVYAKTGSVPACREASETVWQALKSGTWNVGRETFGWTVRALAALAKMDESDARATVDGWTDEEVKEFARLAEVKLWKAEDDVRRAKESAKTAKGGLTSFLKKAK